MILRRAWHRIRPALRMPTMADALPVAEVPALGPDGHLHHLILPGYGLIEAPFERTVERFGNQQRANGRRMSVVATTSDVAVALRHLELRSHPDTRYVAVDLGGWTAVLTNDTHGSDFHDHHNWATRSVGVRVIRVVDKVAEWTKRDGRRRRRSFDAWIFELYGLDTEPIRTVSSSNDSDRWAFHLAGEPFPIEATFPYDAPRPRDRFTRKQLRALIKAIGATPLTERVLLNAPRFALMADHWGAAGTASTWPTYTLGQLDDAGFMAFDWAIRALRTMQDHPGYASTAVLAMERAISYQPAYEPILRDQLARARRIASRT